MAKLSAMQELAKKDFSKMSSELKCNFSGQEFVLNEDGKKKLINDESSTEGKADLEKVLIHEKSKTNAKHKPHCRACGGKMRKSSEDASDHFHRKECNQCEQAKQQSEEKTESSGKDFCSANNDRLHSGHAKTHSIVINLDDNSRFTDEVTV